MYIKFKWTYIFLIVLMLSLTACGNDNAPQNTKIEENTVVKIGVPSLDNEIYAYDMLETELEKHLNLDIKLVDISPYSENVRTNDDYMEHLEKLLAENVVDMCIGIPSYQLSKAIDKNLLLDITDSILEIENIHKGAVDISKKMGNGNLYFIPAAIYNIYMVFQNQLILNELNSSLPAYISWDEFKGYLDTNLQLIQDNDLTYDPLALAVKDMGSEELFIGYEFFMQALGLGTRIIEDNKLTPAARDYYTTFGKIISDYGKGYEAFDNAKYPKDYIFTTGNYMCMLGQSYDLEIFLNTDLNDNFNRTSPFTLNVDFPLKISFINFDGSKTQNLRDTSICINKQTKYKDQCISILNTLLSKDYALKMIESRDIYSHFASSVYSYPTYYDSDTVAALNKSYDGKFDISLLYDVDYGNPTYHNDVEMGTIIESFNEGFTEIYNNNGDASVINNTIISMEKNFDS